MLQVAFVPEGVLPGGPFSRIGRHEFHGDGVQGDGLSTALAGGPIACDPVTRGMAITYRDFITFGLAPGFAPGPQGRHDREQ